jgi:CDP-glucose 4,6-dehydratase
VKQFFAGKKILITGHTGFKGSWLCSWLLMYNTELYGYSKIKHLKPSMFDICGLDECINSTYGDILDFEKLNKIIQEVKPDIIFHLAAQAITSLAYQNPRATFETNIIGTTNILESLRLLDKPCILVNVTSDKSYLNNEWYWSYRETDMLGGTDPYSASKAGAEMVAKAYFNTFFRYENDKIMGTGRAGNIIGGGDWAPNRIVPDCIRAWGNGDIAEIRNPNAVRPWQHVLEPIYGYILLSYSLFQNRSLNGEAFNFGPDPMQAVTVKMLVSMMGKYMNLHGFRSPIKVVPSDSFREAVLLKLNSEKAQTLLGWQPVLEVSEAIRQSCDWYANHFNGHQQMLDYTQSQIVNFEKSITLRKDEEVNHFSC